MLKIGFEFSVFDLGWVWFSLSDGSFAQCLDRECPSWTMSAADQESWNNCQSTAYSLHGYQCSVSVVWQCCHSLRCLVHRHVVRCHVFQSIFQCHKQIHSLRLKRRPYMERRPWLSSSLEWWRLGRVRRASLILLASRCLRRLIYTFLLEVLLGVACGSGCSFVLRPSLSDSLSWLVSPQRLLGLQPFFTLCLYDYCCVVCKYVFVLYMDSTLNVLYYHPNKQNFHKSAINTFNVYQKSSWIDDELNVLI